MKNLISKLGGRKFLLAFVTLIGVAVASLTGYEIDANLRETLVGVLGTYLLGQGLADGLSGGKTASK
ncbi:MAG: hypothetical protein L6R28_01595 [Planctomycetes bacterium]|nr:hypothetical protein [Planctomycetota bacterium]